MTRHAQPNPDNMNAREVAWTRVVEATETHNISTVRVDLFNGRSRVYMTCECGNQPDRESFTEEWEFTDHIRRLAFTAAWPEESE